MPRYAEKPTSTPGARPSRSFTFSASAANSPLDAEVYSTYNGAMNSESGLRASASAEAAIRIKSSRPWPGWVRMRVIRIMRNETVCIPRSLFPCKVSHDFFHASDNTAVEHYLDSMRMMRRISQNALNNPFRQLSRSLILLLYNAHSHSGFDL